MVRKPGSGHPSPVPSSTNTAGPCPWPPASLQLGKEAGKGKRGRKEQWCTAGQMFCLLTTHRRPDFHRLDPRPLLLGEQEDTAFSSTELRCRIQEGCPQPTWRESQHDQHFPGVTGQTSGKRRAEWTPVLSVTIPVQVRCCSEFIHWWTMAMGTWGVGYKARERTPRAAPVFLLPSFIHLFTFRTVPRKPSQHEGANRTRASGKPKWAHTEPGTFYPITKGTLTKTFGNYRCTL